MKKLSIALLALTAALLILVGGAQAYGDTVVVFNDQAAGGGAQGWTGNLASLFTANATTYVVALGVYNPSGSGQVTGPNNIEVALYNITTGQQVGSTVTFVTGNTYTIGGAYGLDIFQPFTATLTAGDLYEVDAVGFNPSYPNANTGDGAPGPVFDGAGYLTWSDYSYYDSSTSLDFPSPGGVGTGDPHIYDAGTLEILTPEPRSLLLLGTGLLGLAFVAFRRSKVIRAL